MAYKTSIEDLAIFGGKPAFEDKLHVGSPNIGDRRRLSERINDILDKRRLTNNGPYVQEFEKRVALCIGVKHCIATCSGTAALEIAIRALGLKGEVIVPSLTFVATAHALQWQEITPVFCDIKADTYHIDPKKAEGLITPKTSAILAVHLWARPCAIDALTDVTRRHGLKLLFDAAHVFGCSYKDKVIGGFGDAEVFSFHATKFVNTFEGGAIATNNDVLAEKIRLMKNFGFKGYDNVIYIGTNGKMNELSAAMGLTSLESIDEFIAKNQRNYLRYRQELADAPGVKLMVYDEKEKSNYQYIVAEVDEKNTGISRDRLIELLWAEGIIARRYFYPGCHRMEPYRSQERNASQTLPLTEEVLDRVIQLPTGKSVASDDVSKICDIIRFVVSKGAVIDRRLRETGRGPTDGA